MVKNVKKEDSTIGKEVNVNSITTEDALNLKVNSVYHLEPKEFDEDLKSKLDKGDLFSFLLITMLILNLRMELF